MLLKRLKIQELVKAKEAFNCVPPPPRVAAAAAGAYFLYNTGRGPSFGSILSPILLPPYLTNFLAFLNLPRGFFPPPIIVLSNVLLCRSR